MKQEWRSPIRCRSSKNNKHLIQLWSATLSNKHENYYIYREYRQVYKPNLPC